MEPGLFNISHYRGTSFEPIVLGLYQEGLNPTDADVQLPWAGASAILEVRKGKNGPLVLKWSTADSTIDLSDTALEIKAREWADMDIAAGVYNYDLVVFHTNSKKLPYLYGTFTILERTSRTI